MRKAGTVFRRNTQCVLGGRQSGAVSGATAGASVASKFGPGGGGIALSALVPIAAVIGAIGGLLRKSLKKDQQ